MNGQLFDDFCASIKRVNCNKIHMLDSTFMHASVGIADETGELMQILKRALYYGEKLDNDHIMEEYGDILFYIVMDCMRIAVSSNLSVLFVFETILQRNIAKLEARYPNGFREEDAHGHNRDLEKEKVAMLQTGTVKAVRTALKDLESLGYRNEGKEHAKTKHDTNID